MNAIGVAMMLARVRTMEYQVMERMVRYEGDPVPNASFDGLSAEQCEERCDNRSLCNSFTYCSGNGWSGCYLKEACIVESEPLVNETNWNGCVTYYKNCSAVDPYLAMTLIVSQGHNLEDLKTANLGTCAEACTRHPSCNSFTFYAPSLGCHLKDKCVDPDEKTHDPSNPASVYRTFYRPCAAPTSTNAPTTVQTSLRQVVTANTKSPSGEKSIGWTPIVHQALLVAWPFELLHLLLI
eukprot:TRINITY_DN101296_c0_g1_i1.p1 TRINITY_DN101296_c0_g1~~TRINITY_DN101296_c0_g1_i1.p1  ORF type:complete len:261 (+),score=21.43 TRINITY_DN101296_c0_g1_i1:72-785(+)